MYIIIMAAIAVIVTLIGIFALIRNKSFGVRPATVAFLSALSIVFYIFSIMAGNEHSARQFAGAYLFSLTLIAMQLIRYVSGFTAAHINEKVHSFFTFLSIAVLLGDAILLNLNGATGIVFTLTPEYDAQGVIIGWIRTMHWGYIIHEVMVCTLIAGILHTLLKKLFNCAREHIYIYLPVLITFLLMVLLHVLSYALQWKINYSFILLPVLVFEMYYFTFVGIPMETENKVQKLIAESVSYAEVCYDYDGRCIYMNSFARRIFRTADEGNAYAQRYYVKLVKIIEAARDRLRERAGEADKRNPFLQQETPIKDGNMELEFVEGSRAILRDTIIVDGRSKIFEVEFGDIFDADNKKQGSYLKLLDITDDVHALAEEEFRATHDPLTRVCNRTCFFDQAADRLLKDSTNRYYMICTNIRDFKLVNDLFGTESGDAIISAEARMLTEFAGKNAIIGRIMSEKFAVLMLKDNYNARKFEEMIKGLTHITRNVKYDMHVYAGIYEIANPFENVQTMYDKAVLAMNSIYGDYDRIISVYDTEIMERMMYEKNLLGEFDVALDEGAFEIFLQPQLDRDEKVLGAEALVRWVHPTLGLLLPGEFLSVLEETGDICRMDEFVWDRAAALLSQWKKAGSDRFVSVNICVKDFYHTDLYTKFTGLAEKYDIDPSKLRLEITEGVLMHDAELRTGILDRLKAAGFCVEMDDFGKGYSSLNMLKDIDVNVLKVDMQLIKNTSETERGRVILKAIIEMAKALNMVVTAEGVSDIEQFEELKKMGVDVYQGFAFAKPMPINEFESTYGKK